MPVPSCVLPIAPARSAGVPATVTVHTYASPRRGRVTGFRHRQPFPSLVATAAARLRTPGLPRISDTRLRTVPRTATGAVPAGPEQVGWSKLGAALVL